MRDGKKIRLPAKSGRNGNGFGFQKAIDRASYSLGEARGMVLA
jgi:hypothetical protein